MRKATALAIGAVVVAVMLVLVYVLVSGGGNEGQDTSKDREGSIPLDAVKVLPAADIYPPILHSSSWQEPVPLPGPINTAGAEDSPFVLPDGSAFYFFFTPDVRKSANEQLFDGAFASATTRFNLSRGGETAFIDGIYAKMRE